MKQEKEAQRKQQKENDIKEKKRQTDQDIEQKQKDATIGEIPYAATIIRHSPDNEVP